MAKSSAGQSPSLDAAQPPCAQTAAAVSDGGMPTLAEIEKRQILVTLDQCKGNRTHAAKLLGVSIRTLRNKLHEYNGTQPGAEADESELAEKQD